METPLVPPMLEAPPPPGGPGSVRGRYLPRHHARVIETGNLFVVEFVEHPWYTAAAQQRSRQRRSETVARAAAATAVVTTAAAAGSGMALLPVWQIALLWGVSLSALTLGLLRLF